MPRHQVTSMDTIDSMAAMSAALATPATEAARERINAQLVRALGVPASFYEGANGSFSGGTAAALAARQSVRDQWFNGNTSQSSGGQYEAEFQGQWRQPEIGYFEDGRHPSPEAIARIDAARRRDQVAETIQPTIRRGTQRSGHPLRGRAYTIPMYPITDDNRQRRDAREQHDAHTQSRSTPTILMLERVLEAVWVDIDKQRSWFQIHITRNPYPNKFYTYHAAVIMDAVVKLAVDNFYTVLDVTSSSDTFVTLVFETGVKKVEAGPEVSIERPRRRVL